MQNGLQHKTDETDSNFWSTAVLAPPLSGRVVCSLRTGRRILERDRGCRGVTTVICHLWCAIHRRRWWQVKLRESVPRRILVDEST